MKQLEGKRNKILTKKELYIHIGILICLILFSRIPLYQADKHGIYEEHIQSITGQIKEIIYEGEKPVKLSMYVYDDGVLSEEAEVFLIGEDVEAAELNKNEAPLFNTYTLNLNDEERILHSTFGQKINPPFVFWSIVGYICLLAFVVVGIHLLIRMRSNRWRVY